jgi:hypothetical protein
MFSYAGVSRSATIVIAFLMREYGWLLGDAFTFTKSKREYIFPNKGFKSQLQQFEITLGLRPYGYYDYKKFENNKHEKKHKNGDKKENKKENNKNKNKNNKK